MSEEIDRLKVSPENALPHVILEQSYPVEVVATIAAACPGSNHRERVLDALALLAAAEEIANPDPWKDQHLSRNQGDGLGDLPNDSDTQPEIEATARQIIARASKDGVILRKDVLDAVYEWAGRSGEESARNKSFTTWGEAAAADSLEVAAWRDYVGKHPTKRTIEHCKKWRTAWRKKGGKKRASSSGRRFIEQFETPRVKGQAAEFRDSDAALLALAGDESGSFIPFLHWVKERRRALMLHSSNGEWVSPSDRRNKGSRRTEEE